MNQAKEQPSDTHHSCAEQKNGAVCKAQCQQPHEQAAVPVRKDFPLDRAALLGCAVTGYGRAVHAARIKPASISHLADLG